MDDGIVQGSIAVLVGGVDFGASRQQTLGSRHVAGGGGHVQRCVPLDVGGRGVGSPQQQVADDVAQFCAARALEQSSLADLTVYVQ